MVVMIAAAAPPIWALKTVPPTNPANMQVGTRHTASGELQPPLIKMVADMRAASMTTRMRVRLSLR